MYRYYYTVDWMEAKCFYGIIGDFKVVDGLAVVGRRGPEQLVAVRVGRVDDAVLRLGDDVGLLGSGPFGHRVRLLTRPLAKAHLVLGREAERVHRLRLQVLQDVRDIYFGAFDRDEKKTILRLAVTSR